MSGLHEFQGVASSNNSEPAFNSNVIRVVIAMIIRLIIIIIIIIAIIAIVITMDCTFSLSFSIPSSRLGQSASSPADCPALFHKPRSLLCEVWFNLEQTGKLT